MKSSVKRLNDSFSADREIDSNDVVAGITSDMMAKPSEAGSNGPSAEISADRPIESHDQDRLGRTRFASQLATAISKWQENDSLVIALYGEWGIGKSSIKNLVLEELRAAAGNDAPDIVEFNPWQWTGHEDLSAAFFREVLTRLRGRKSSKSAQQVAKRIRQYVAYLGLMKVFLDGPKGVVALILAVFGALAVAPPFFLTQARTVTFMIALGAVALVLAALIGWGQELLEKLASWLDLIGPGAGSLEERKKGVVAALQRYRKTVLVVIDDVDRLTPTEIQAVFQLIKANADFPRFVYLVMFQRSIVVRALAELTKEDGAAFLEKIVQVGFDVPQARQVEVDQVLFEGLDRVLGPRGSEQINQIYFGNVYYGSLREYYRDLRDVKRFLGTLEFHVNLLRTNGALDVNPVDLIAIEALRLFEPDFYRRVCDNKALLTSSRSRDSADRNKASSELRQLLAGLPTERAPAREQLLKHLFPTTAFAFGGLVYSAQSAVEWDRDLRVCVPDLFDRYFQLGLSKGEISQYEVELLLAASSDTAALTRELERHAREGRLVAALDRLDSNKSKLPSSNAVAALTTLLDIGELLPEPTPGAILGPEWTICRIAYQLLIREPENDRITKLEQILSGTTGLHIPVMLVSINTKPNERQTEPEKILISDSAAPRMQAICVQKIRDTASEGRLLNHRDLAYLLFRWREWGTDAEPHQWALNVTAHSPEGALAFLRPFLHKGTRQTSGDQVARINYFMKYSEIEPFVDLTILEGEIAKLSEARLPDHDRMVVQEFRKAVDRKRSGKKEGDFGWDAD
jgi:predicted KAP-like P-loop ATPase